MTDTVPTGLRSEISPTLVLAVFTVIAGAAAIYAAYLATRRRDAVPIVVCAGALICAFNEPIYDLLGKILYADNHYMAFTSFDRSVPWFLVLGYLPWVGLLPYLIARAMHNGISRNRLHLIAFLSFVSVVVVESCGTSFHAWTYYGDAPLRFLVVAPQMAPVPIVGGFLLYAVADRMVGWRRTATAFVISTVSLPMVFASASWPLYVGLNSDLPAAVNWALGIVMLLLTAGTVVAVTGLAETVRRSRSNTAAGDAGETIEPRQSVHTGRW